MTRRRVAGLPGVSRIASFWAAGLAFALALCACTQVSNLEEPEVLAPAYSDDWESLADHKTPDWFLDAKFGIFIHWGVYSVPAWGPTDKYAEWYPRYMYQQTETHAYHERTYGPIPSFGYKDFIPDFTAENWDPEEWASLFERAGARLVVPVAEHHDGFALWDSALTQWDAVDMGPGRDLIGDLEKAVRAKGLKYAPSYHRERHFSYFRKDENDWPWGVDPNARPLEGIEAEIEGYPEAAALYGPFHIDDDYIADYVARWKELESRYHPDMMWLDDIPLFYTTPDAPQAPAFKAALRRMIADYLNQASSRGQDVAVNNKGHREYNFPAAFGLVEADYMKSETILDRPWIGSRAMGRSYGLNIQEEPTENRDALYDSSENLIETMVDIVSKNGFFLLDIGPRADGTITDAQTQRLLDIGQWLDRYGEGIYATRPWRLSANENWRYTRKGDDLYLTSFEWPGDRLTIPSEDGVSQVDLVISLLGDEGAIDFTPDKEGNLIADLSGVIEPVTGPESAAFTFKIERGAATLAE